MVIQIAETAPPHREGIVAELQRIERWRSRDTG